MSANQLKLKEIDLELVGLTNQIELLLKGLGKSKTPEQVSFQSQFGRATSHEWLNTSLQRILFCCFGCPQDLAEVGTRLEEFGTAFDLVQLELYQLKQKDEFRKIFRDHKSTYKELKNEYQFRKSKYPSIANDAATSLPALMTRARNIQKQPPINRRAKETTTTTIVAMHNHELSWLESYALSANGSQRLEQLKAPGQIHRREIQYRYIQQKQLEFIEKYYPESLSFSGVRRLPSLTQPLPKDAIRFLEDDPGYKAIMKGWYENYPAAKEKELMRKHAFLKFPSYDTRGQIEFFETLQKDMRINYNHKAPYVATTSTIKTDDDSSAVPVEPPILNRQYASILNPQNWNNLDQLLRVSFLNRGGWRAFESHATAQEWLTNANLFEQYEMEQYINSQQRADISNIEKIYQAAMKEKYSSFRSSIAGLVPLMTLEQLQYLASCNSKLKKSNGEFLSCLFKKQVLSPQTLPHPISDLTPDEKRTFYSALWKFAKEDLGNGEGECNTYNEPKARIYFECLRVDVEEFGVYNFNHFYKLLKIPLRSNGSGVQYLTSHWYDKTNVVYGNISTPSSSSIFGEDGYILPTKGIRGVSPFIASEPILKKVTPAQERQFIEQFITYYYQQADVDQWKDGKLYKYFEESYLKGLFARAKLSQERSWKLDDPNSKEFKLYTSYMTNLNETPKAQEWLLETRLEFTPTSNSRRINPVLYHDPNAPVSITLNLKNCGKLLFSVFTIQTKTYYTQLNSNSNQDELDPSQLSIEGLLPNYQFEQDFSSIPSMQVIQRNINLPMLSSCHDTNGGVFLVEIVSITGDKIRCVIKKGVLTHVSSSDAPHGQVLRLLNWKGQEIYGSVLLNGHVYESDPKTGLIIIPYASARKANQKLILNDSWSGRQPVGQEEKSSQDSSSLPSTSSSADVIIHHTPGSASEFYCPATFIHEAASYSWTATCFLDREALLAKSKADILINVKAFLNSTIPIDTSLLKNLTLVITTENYEGVKSSQRILDLKLSSTGETTHTMAIPQSLRLISLQLSSDIYNVATSSKQEFSYSTQFELNNIDDSSKFDNLFLRQGTDGYSVYCLGKTGEPVRGRVIDILLKHYYLKEPLRETLATDMDGGIHLGELAYITRLNVTTVADAASGQKSTATFDLGANGVTTINKKNFYRTDYNVIEGAKIILPYSFPFDPKDAPKKIRTTNFSLCQIVEDGGLGSAAPSLLREITTSGNALSLITSNEVTDFEISNSLGGSEKQFLQILTGDESMGPGHYQLHIKDYSIEHALINIIVTPDPNNKIIAPSKTSSSSTATNANEIQPKLIMNEFIHERRRFIQVNPSSIITPPIHILSAGSVPTPGGGIESDEFVIQLNQSNTNAGVRVHIWTTHFHPYYDAHTRFCRELYSFGRVNSTSITLLPESTYLKSVSLGDESRYILDRIHATKSVGNMLTKPGLLLNAKFKSDTHFEADVALKVDETFATGESTLARLKVQNELLESVNYGSLDQVDESCDKRQVSLRSAGLWNHERVVECSMNEVEMQMSFGDRLGRLKRAAGEVISGVVELFTRKQLRRGPVGDTVMPTPLTQTRTGGRRPLSENGDQQYDPSYEFLRRGSFRRFNLRPDEKGQIRLSKRGFDQHHSLAIILALDGAGNSCWYRVPIAPVRPSTPAASSSASSTRSAIESSASSTKSANSIPLGLAYRDLRLHPALDSSKHFNEQYLSTTLYALGEQFTIENMNESSVETYETLGDVWRLLKTLTMNTSTLSTLNQFNFLLDWSDLNEEMKLRKLNEFSSHELHIYLYYKDRLFFDKFIYPFIQAKLVKTFVDEWLLGQPLESWLEPTKLAKLNCIEKLLLAQRLPSNLATALNESIINAVNVQSKDPVRHVKLFKTALESRSLESNKVQATMFEPAKSVLDASASNFRIDSPTTGSSDQPSQATPPPIRRAVSQAKRDSARLTCVEEQTNLSRSDKKKKKLNRIDNRWSSSNNGAEEDGDDSGQSFADLQREIAVMAAPRKFFEPPPTTKEYEERNWYDISSSLESQQQHYHILSQPNPFWKDFATWQNASLSDPKSGRKMFISGNVFYATNSFTEIILALSVLDLPVTSSTPPKLSNTNGIDYTITSTGSPILIYSKLMREIESDANAVASSHISVLTFYLDPTNPTRRVLVDDGVEEQQDAYLELPNLEFEPMKIYKSRVILTNLSSNQLKLHSLIQIPEGAMAISYQGKCSFNTTTQFFQIPPFQSVIHEYYFYFPTLGQYQHYPVQLFNQSGKLVGFGSSPVHPVDGSPVLLKVLPRYKFTRQPKSARVVLPSWAALKVQGTDSQIMDYLRSARPESINLSSDSAVSKNHFFDDVPIKDLYFRCSRLLFWSDLIQFLRSKQIFDEVIWSYSLKHLIGLPSDSMTELAQRRPFLLPILREYLFYSFDSSVGGSAKHLISQCSTSYFYSSLFSYDRFGLYQDAQAFVLEYTPLFNSRAHPLNLIREGKVKTANTAPAKTQTDGSSSSSSLTTWQSIQIQNKEFRVQYTTFIQYLVDRYSGLDKMSHACKLILCYYLLLQERIDDAKKLFKQITVQGLKAELSANSNSKADSTTSGPFTSNSPIVPFPGVRCDGCQANPIQHQRWQCQECVNFDYCQSCKESGKEVALHKKSHIMVQMDIDGKPMRVTPLTMMEEKKEEASSSSSASSSTVDLDEYNAAVSLESMLIQYDYFDAYISFFTATIGSGSSSKVDGTSRALSIAKRYQSYPVKKVRELFSEIEHQLFEASNNVEIVELNYAERIGQKTEADGIARAKEMDALAATEPTLEFVIEGKSLRVNSQYLSEYTINFYLMDLELLFSTSPFLSTSGSGTTSSTTTAASNESSFLFVHPNQSMTINVRESGLEAEAKSKEDAENDAPARPITTQTVNQTRLIPIPNEFSSANFYVQLVSTAYPHLTSHKVVYQNHLTVSLVENYGTIKVRAKSGASGSSSGKPLSKVYCKAFAQFKSGEISFYKDGYTDHRGVWDYASLSSDKLSRVDKFAVLISSQEYGAVVKQAKPPAIV